MFMGNVILYEVLITLIGYYYQYKLGRQSRL